MSFFLLLVLHPYSNFPLSSELSQTWNYVSIAQKKKLGLGKGNIIESWTGKFKFIGKGVLSVPGRGTLQNMKMIQKHDILTMAISICNQYLCGLLREITDQGSGITFSLWNP